MEKQSLPFTIIEDGYFFEENLQKAGKNKKWLESVLKKHHSTVKDTWLLSVDGEDQVVWMAKEDAL